MRNIIRVFIIKIRTLFRFIRLKKTNQYVREYYKLNKNKRLPYESNIWSKNYYWDYFLQSLPHSIKSQYYIPYDYYSSKIEPALNNKEYSAFIVMKNMYDKLYGNSDIKLPKTLLRCMNYILMDSDYKTIQNVDFLLENIKQDIIIKPASDSYGGFGIRKYIYNNNCLTDIKTDLRLNINEVCTTFKGSFIIQEVIKQHPEIAKFHPYSLNTIRACSYRSVKTNNVVLLMSMLRMGHNKSYVDNATSNGIAVAINKDGSLNEYAFNQYGKCFTHHPLTNIAFKGCKIPFFNKVEECVIKLANIVPYQRIIGWDISIDEEGNPVLIELNIGTGIWMYQIVTGTPLFGNLSIEVKEYIDSLTC